MLTMARGMPSATPHCCMCVFVCACLRTAAVLEELGEFWKIRLEGKVCACLVQRTRGSGRLFGRLNALTRPLSSSLNRCLIGLVRSFIFFLDSKRA
jgi:hypothetical protein